MKKKINKKRIVRISTIEELGKNEQEVKDRLTELSKKRTSLVIDGKQLIDPDHLLSILEDYVRMRVLANDNDWKRKQMEGIKRALKKKQEGTGTYGRPCIQLPDDFEEKVIDIIENGGSLSAYQGNLDMARSTFYKYVRKAVHKKNMKRR